MDSAPGRVFALQTLPAKENLYETIHRFFAAGRYYDLHVIPETGAILDPKSDRPVLTVAEIRAQLESKGYTDIDDLDLDGAVWEAEAIDASGIEVDLVINGFDGSVLYSEADD